MISSHPSSAAMPKRTAWGSSSLSGSWASRASSLILYIKQHSSAYAVITGSEPFKRFKLVAFYRSHKAKPACIYSKKGFSAHCGFLSPFQNSTVTADSHKHITFVYKLVSFTIDCSVNFDSTFILLFNKGLKTQINKL